MGRLRMKVTDTIQIGESQITLVDTASLLSQDAPDSGVDGGNRTSVASSESRLTSPQTITHTHCNTIQDTIVATNTSHLTGLTTNIGEQHSGG